MLRHLALSTNSIEKISSLSGMDNLHILSLGRNLLKKIENVEVVADTLEELWLSYNQIEKLVSCPADCVRTLKNRLRCNCDQGQRSTQLTATTCRLFAAAEWCRETGAAACAVPVQQQGEAPLNACVLFFTASRQSAPRSLTKLAQKLPLLCQLHPCHVPHRSETSQKWSGWQQRSGWRTCCSWATPCTTTTRTTALCQSTGWR